MQQRRLGPWQVAPVAFGGMNLSHGYGAAASPAQAQSLVAAALDAGMNLYDTAALYGFGSNEELLGPLLKPHRNRIVLASKCGMAGVRGEDGVVRRVIDGRPATLRRNCEDSLRRLGTEVIDLYYLHRWDKNVPIEDSVGEMSRLVEEGKVRALGLSEVGVEALRRAHSVHPITALQSEYSLWTRNAELGTLAACQELGIAYVAFSPVGRGFLSGKLTDVSTRQGRYPPGHATLCTRELCTQSGVAGAHACRGRTGRLHAGRTGSGLGAASGRACDCAARHHQAGAPGREPARCAGAAQR